MLALLAFIVASSFLIKNVNGISCYNYTSVEGQPPDAPPSIAVSCLSCSKTLSVLNMSGLVLKMGQWSCNNNNDNITGGSFFQQMIGAPVAVSQSNIASPSVCTQSTTAMGYSDGSSFMLSCTCCGNYCNGGAQFCTALGSLPACVGMNIPPLPVVSLTAGVNGSVSISNVTNSSLIASPVSCKTCSASSIFGVINVLSIITTTLFGIISLEN